MQVSDQIIKVLEKLCEKFGVVIDFTKDSIVPYLQDLASRIVQYEINTSIVWIIIGVLFLVAGIIIFKYARKYHKRESKSQEYLGLDYYYIPLYIVSVLIIGLSLTCLTTQIFDIIQAKTLPEKTILDYINYYRNGVI